jgi:UDP-glucose 4-epimerase
MLVGAASLVGSAAAEELLARGAVEVRLFDNFSLGSGDAIAHLRDDSRVTVVEGDILKLHSIWRPS